MTISVIMPAHNASTFIGEAIDSVMLQKRSANELIIIDDASTDNTFEIALEKQKRYATILLERHQSNLGVAAARNHATELASGKYIAFLDADDLWLPHKLEQQCNFMEQTGAEITCTSYIAWNGRGYEKVIRSLPETSYRRLLRGNTIGNLTAMYDVEALGKLYQTAKPHEDYIMWLHVAKKGKTIRGLPDVLAKYRVRDDSISSNKCKSLSWVWSIYKHELELNVIARSWLLACYLIHALRKRYV